MYVKPICKASVYISGSNTGFAEILFSFAASLASSLARSSAVLEILSGALRTTSSSSTASIPSASNSSASLYSPKIGLLLLFSSFCATLAVRIPLDLSDVEVPPRVSAPTLFADVETAPALDSVAVSKLGLL